MLKARNLALFLTAFGLTIPALAQEKRDGGDKPAAAGKAEIGKPAPAFDLKDGSGKAVKLSDYKDKIVVLEWVNRDCPVSKGVVPDHSGLQKKYAEKGVVWLGIDSTAAHTNGADNDKFRKDNSIGYPYLSDPDGTVGHAYGAQTTPHIFIVDKGVLVYAGAHKEKDGDRNYISESLDALLAGKTVPVAQTKSFGCSVKYKK